MFTHAENVGAFVLARGAFRAIHPIRMAIQRRRVWVGVTETAMCMYTSSRKSDVLFRRCCRCRFSDHPAVHKSRGIEADNSRAIPLWGYKVCRPWQPHPGKNIYTQVVIGLCPKRVLVDMAITERLSYFIQLSSQGLVFYKDMYNNMCM